MYIVKDSRQLILLFTRQFKLEQSSIERRKTKTEAIIMANHNKLKQHSEPMRT